MRISGGIPEELCQLADQMGDEEWKDCEDDEVNGNKRTGNGDGTTANTLLSYAQFLFKVARTEQDRRMAMKATRKWIKQACLEAQDRGRARYLISKTLEAMAINLTVDLLPRACSLRDGFPVELPLVDGKSLPNGVRVEAPARIDIAGGWTDTPPITYDLASPAVVNAAVSVDGRRPITVEIHRLELMAGIWVQTGDGTLTCFESAAELLENASRPCEAGSLVCAVIVTSGVFDNLISKGSRDGDHPLTAARGGRFEFRHARTSGLFVKCHSTLPCGTGLGTSSILSGALLAALWTLFGRRFDDNDLIRAVLKVEQCHTTKGGWQDQVGGLLPGVKVGSLASDRARNVIWKHVPLSEELEAEINARLVLVYTGKTRLAKNLLETVILNWIRGELEVDLAFRELESSAQSATKKLLSGVFPFEEVAQYHELKKTVATGAEPAFVKDLIDEMKRQSISVCSWIAGAGGGGFLYVYLNEGKTIDDLRTFIERNKTEHSNLTVSSIQIDNEPLRITSF